MIDVIVKRLVATLEVVLRGKSCERILGLVNRRELTAKSDLEVLKGRPLILLFVLARKLESVIVEVGCAALHHVGEGESDLEFITCKVCWCTLDVE